MQRVTLILGVAFNNPSVCSAHGSCVSNNVCVCRTDYSSVDCSTLCTVTSQWVASVTNFSTQYSLSNWAAHQVVGAPNTYPSYGDIPTSYTPSTVGKPAEHLELQYNSSVTITSIAIYETYHPGGISNISAFVSGAWVPLYAVGSTAWTGLTTSRIFSPALTQGYTSNRIRLDMKLTGFPGFYEIDAVQLSGILCTVPISCFGILKSNTSLVCSGHGTCVGTNNCTSCTGGFTGLECNSTTCYSKFNTDPTVCSGNGTCSSVNNCACNSGYSGLQCQFYSCFGVNYTNPAVCSGHGSCNSVNSCSCQAAYTGPNCTMLNTCNGLLVSDPRVCSGRGACTSFNSCNCSFKYTGSNCQYSLCSSVSSANSSVCNGTGVCRSPSYSLQFNSPYNYAAPYGVSSGDPLILGARYFDISATIYKTSASSSVVWAYDRSGEGSVQFRLQSDADGTIALYSSNLANSDSHAAVSAAGTIQLNTWYTIVVSRRNLNISIWINSTLVASANSNTIYDVAPAISNRPNFLIGSRYQVSGTATELHFSGQISLVTVVSDTIHMQPICACFVNAQGSCDASCSGQCLAF